MRLTERKIETLTADGGKKDRLVFDDAQRGLAVRVTASGSRTYLANTPNRQNGGCRQACRRFAVEGVRPPPL